MLTPGEVAHIFGVDPKTVNRWSLTGRIPSVRTPSGQRRYRQTDIDASSPPVRSPAAGPRGRPERGCRR
ncbi:helix-turn-helix domain-containing protein [Streptosporangium saharense]|uniref:helix-turn-helix domain-containing protein n=1 Tax=Streptosporangium saharense TaxID=1706840 RepID=UPI00331DC733